MVVSKWKKGGPPLDPEVVPLTKECVTGVDGVDRLQNRPTDIEADTPHGQSSSLLFASTSSLPHAAELEAMVVEVLTPKVKIKFKNAEYQRVVQMLLHHLTQHRIAGVEVFEIDFIVLCMEQVEDQIHTEEDYRKQHTLVQLIINKLIEDRVVIVYRSSADPVQSDARVLVKCHNPKL
jgi:hypothetical protein